MTHLGSPKRLPAWTTERMVPALLLALIVALASGPRFSAAQQQPPQPQQPPQQPQQQPGPGSPAPVVVKVSEVTLNLADCIHAAHEHQPRLAVQRASLAGAEDGARALDNLAFAALVDREIPIRRKQAALGVTAAAAGVEQAEREVTYAVTRAYFTVLYAREQERIAKSVVDRLEATRDAAQKQLDAGKKEVTDADIKRTSVYIRLARAKQLQAGQGVKRALSALREAIGLEPDVILDVAVSRLPEMEARISREEVVAAALARRSELIRANIFVDVTCLEVEAQNTCIVKKKETFAAGTDIHAITIPQEIPGTEYRPGAVPPEMPTLLVGSRADRMKHAQSLNARARAAVDTIRNLIVLEAEDAFYRWEEASLQIPEAREAAETGNTLSEGLTKDFTGGLKVRVEDVINARVVSSQARASYNEYLYKQILALADLERVTAGAFNAGLVDASVPRIQPGAGKGNGGK